jgi:hypothetical protein
LDVEARQWTPYVGLCAQSCRDISMRTLLTALRTLPRANCAAEWVSSCGFPPVTQYLTDSPPDVSVDACTFRPIKRDTPLFARPSLWDSPPCRALTCSTCPRHTQHARRGRHGARPRQTLADPRHTPVHRPDIPDLPAGNARRYAGSPMGICGYIGISGMSPGRHPARPRDHINT